MNRSSQVILRRGWNPMKAIRLLLGTVFVLAAGCLAFGQITLTGNADIQLQISPANPSMSDSRLEVVVLANLDGVKANNGANILLTSYSLPVGFDPSFVRLISAEYGHAAGYGSAGFTYTQPALANGRGFVTLMNRRTNTNDPETLVELGRLEFELKRPGNTSFSVGSARTVHQGALAALPANAVMQPIRMLWSGHEYTVKIKEGATIPSLLCPSWFSVPGMFQGMALLNEGTQAASIQMFGWGTNGSLVQAASATNPAGPITLAGLNQKAGLAGQMFNMPDTANVENGWIEIKTDTPAVSGFFMQGVNTPIGETHQMDGIKMTYSPASRVIFPLVQYSSRAPEISISNPAGSPVDLEIRVRKPNGEFIRTVKVKLPAHGGTVQEIADALKGVDVMVFVKNPINPEIDLWIGAIERIAKAGIKKLGAIHRGFSSYEKTTYRNQPNWQLPIELRRRIPDLPILCDPSHIAGAREYLHEISQKAMDLNFDGLMIESHIDPDKALSDAAQQITPNELHELLSRLILRSPSTSDPKLLDVLGELRQQIDIFDDHLIDLMEQRMKIAETIGRYKKENNITILQSARWDEIVKRVIVLGRSKGLSSELIDTIFRAIHQESINRQMKIMNNGIENHNGHN